MWRKCIYVEDEKTLYYFGPRGFPNGKPFFRDLFPEFFGFKKFLTKTLFLFRHSMPLKSEMV